MKTYKVTTLATGTIRYFHIGRPLVVRVKRNAETGRYEHDMQTRSTVANTLGFVRTRRKYFKLERV